MDGLCNSDRLSRPITRVTLNARDHPAEARLLEIKSSAKRGLKIAIGARVKMSGLGAVRCPRLPEGPGQLQEHLCSGGETLCLVYRTVARGVTKRMRLGTQVIETATKPKERLDD
jgi:hypothetical protein